MEGEMCNEILHTYVYWNSTLRIRTERDMVVMILEFSVCVCRTVNLRTQVFLDRDMKKDSDCGMGGMDENDELLRKHMVRCVWKETSMLVCANDAKIFLTKLYIPLNIHMHWGVIVPEVNDEEDGSVLMGRFTTMKRSKI